MTEKSPGSTVMQRKWNRLESQTEGVKGLNMELKRQREAVLWRQSG